VTHPDRFAARYPFVLDGFQRRAIDALDAGESVLVAAPTGSGKTVAAEFAIDRAPPEMVRFYTTPLKALSNQQFGTSSRAWERRRWACSPGTTRSTGTRR
jgi:ATP-dependent RNA helicase HelY